MLSVLKKWCMTTTMTLVPQKRIWQQMTSLSGLEGKSSMKILSDCTFPPQPETFIATLGLFFSSCEFSFEFLCLFGDTLLQDVND